MEKNLEKKKPKGKTGVKKGDKRGQYGDAKHIDTLALRKEIPVDILIKSLVGYATKGKPKLTRDRVRAHEVLLKKVLPDLAPMIIDQVNTKDGGMNLTIRMEKSPQQIKADQEAEQKAKKIEEAKQAEHQKIFKQVITNH